MELTFYPPINGSRLLALPEELRALIFYHLWTFSPVIRTQFMSTPTESCLIGSMQSCNTEALIGLPRWLLTCTTFLQEGMEEFHRIFDSTIGPYHVRLSAHHHTTLISPDARGSMTMWMDTLSTSSRAVFDHGACFELSEDGQGAIERVLGFIVVDDSDNTEDMCSIQRQHLHTFRMRASFVNVCIFCQQHNQLIQGREIWRLDLRLLENYPFHLDVFEFEVTGVDTRAVRGGDIHFTNCWHRAQLAFEREVKRVGTVLTRDPWGDLIMESTSASQKNIMFRFRRSKEDWFFRNAIDEAPQVG